MYQAPLLIDGKDIGNEGSRWFERANPISSAVVSRSRSASPSEAKYAADAAFAAFPSWAALGPSERRRHLTAAADLFQRRAGDFVKTMQEETGATAGWAHFNVSLAASMLREAASMTTSILGEIIPSDRPGSLAMAFREPVGVVLGIAPWNAPLILGVRALAVPLACGNSVILKSSEVCPATHRLIGSVLLEAGLPAGVINVVSTAPEDADAAVEAIIAHPGVRRINFTGSTRVGRIIAAKAAKYLKPVLLELGGKAALVVLEDANLDAAVDAAVFGAFANQGQICMSTERIIADEKIADEFVAKLKARVSELSVGDPAEGDPDLGPVFSMKTVEHVISLIDDAKAKGGKVVAGGTSVGTLMAATVVDFVSPGMKIFSEESFGPIVGVVRVSGDEQAIEYANSSEYGLSSAVFGSDSRALGVARRLQTGICHINGPTVHDEPQMPFGGMKSSGYGRFGGKAAINEFTELRWITAQSGSIHYPF